MSEALRIGLAQLNLRVGDIDGNLARMTAAARAAERAGAHCIVHPELAVTSYPPEDLLGRPRFIARAMEAVEALAATGSPLAQVVGHPLSEDGRLYNACSLLRGGRIELTYRKHQLPNYGVFDERRHFTPGSAIPVFDLGGIPTAISICEDVWVPGTTAAARAAGARLLLNVNGSPWHVGRIREREAVLARAAREGAMPIVYVNLVGGQDELVFDGASMVVDATGRCTHRLPEFAEAVEVVAIAAGDPPTPLHAAAVPEPLATAPAVWQALTTGVRDYVQKNGFPGVVLGLSGGIDSALTLCIACDALGAERVTAVLMPSRYTAAMSVEDARAQCLALGVEHRLIGIEPAFRSITRLLAPVFGGPPGDLTEQNVQARCRGMLLMAISNETGRLVLTTSNKSESAVGYATLYGDMAGGFAPLKDCPKTLVYALARWRNARGAPIPARVIERPPSAELRADQRDDDSLPPYDVLDPILEACIEREESPAEIAARGHDAATVARVVAMVDRSEYKRRQAAPGVRITPRAFGRDRRYPITNAWRER